MQNKKRGIKLIIEYDGTEFSGWQVQPNARTVQEEIEKALHELTRESIRITGAGRTDAGVHAKGQVASFQTTSGHSVEVFSRALNHLTPKDIVIHTVEETELDFCARRRAKKRHYRYRLTKKRIAIARQYVWYPFTDLDVDRMRTASEFLIGEHDYAAFCKFNPDVDSTRSHIYEISWSETDEEIRFDIIAIRFFQHMVRILIGTFIEIGNGKRPPEDMKMILETKNRTLAGETIPSHGLCLMGVEY